MKKFCFILACSICISTSVFAKQNVQLPEPNLEKSQEVFSALKERRSTKEFLNKEITPKDLSLILWASYGINNSEGKRTIPTAMNQKDLNIFVATQTGVFSYEANTHSLKQVSTQNGLTPFKTQEYMQNVPTVLIYTAKNKEYGALHAGSSYQNVALIAPTLGMGTVVRGHFNKDDVHKLLNLEKDEHVIISQAIGYKK